MDCIVFFKQSEFKIFKPLGEYGHVFILVKDVYGIWIGIDPTFNGLCISYVPVERVNYLMDTYIHIQLQNFNIDKLQFGYPRLQTCVGLTKSILGIKNLFIWTPRQLYNYLKG